MLLQVLHRVISLLLWNKKLGSTSKRPFESQMKYLRLFRGTICAIGVEVSHILVDSVQRLIKNATSVKRWDTYQKCVEANPNQTRVSTINRIIFAQKKTFIWKQAFPPSEMGIF